MVYETNSYERPNKLNFKIVYRRQKVSLIYDIFVCYNDNIIRNNDILNIIK